MDGLVGWHALILLVVALPFVLAVIGIAADRAHAPLTKAVWVLIVLAFPLLGPVLWFVVGRRSAPGAPS
jgi:hypothetical protein